MKYRKKPVVIEAVTWNGKYTSPGEWPDWFNEAMNGGTMMVLASRRLVIETLEGAHHAEVGDKIIRGVAGELYPCKPAIFDAIYEGEE